MKLMSKNPRSEPHPLAGTPMSGAEMVVQVLAELNRMGVEEIGMVTAPPEPR